ncbi:hypothetical protein EJB05_07041 [Eragrostis curvula]|uniref:Trichome birefringence-like C-terminal domain-containing protein n=1 Tax=Eragrostis curvula TaxID=38414 RepID=A0A5J9WGX1_9POAL|nr:hypothetical protein EJB05_07041 [Eragrostis curvula]
MVQMSVMKRVKGRAPLSVVVAIIGGLALAGIIFTEDLRSITEIMEKKEKDREKKRTSLPARTRKLTRLAVAEEALPPPPAKKKAFDPSRCSVTDGYWAYNRFDPVRVLEQLRGKRMLFVGDSLLLGQWLSFVCLVNSVVPYTARSMERSSSLNVYTATEYNATIEFYWAPFLVESNSDRNIRLGADGRVLHVDAIEMHARRWEGADVLVFDSYVWWMTGSRIKTVWGAFSDDGYEELDAWVAFRLGLKTWANWVDTHIDPNTTKVFFMSISTTHMRSEDWGRAGGVRCYNETRPVTRKGYWGSGSDRRMMEVMGDVLARMRRVPVALLNITQLTEHRVDAHVSVYTEAGGELLTDAQRAEPDKYADCIHWCVPGVPDAWNQILYAHLFFL